MIIGHVGPNNELSRNSPMNKSIYLDQRISYQALDFVAPGYAADLDAHADDSLGMRGGLESVTPGYSLPNVVGRTDRLPVTANGDGPDRAGQGGRR